MKPNIVFLFADDQRYDTVRSLGNDDIITPNLDGLVRQGTSFTNCHIQGATCGAVCMPSRAMLNTGRDLFSLQGEGQEIPEDHALLGETLQQAGYTTFGTGKWHNGISAYSRSFSCGDHIFFGGMDDHWNVPVHSFDPTGRYAGRHQKVADFWHTAEPGTYISDHIGEAHSTDLFACAAEKFIRNYEEDKPFYAYVSFMAPHDPRTMPERFKEMYGVEKIPLPKNFRQYHPIEYANTACRDEVLAPYPRTAEDTKQQLLEYYAMITHLDEAVGRVVKALKETGRYENTVIIYSGDNGLALGQHGLFGKQCHYDHSIRVPLIMCGPGIPENQRRDTYLYLSDLFPTLCDMLDLTIPETVEAKSFWSSVESEESLCRESLYFTYKDKIRSIKYKGMKLMEHVHEGLVTTQLFNSDKDPLEMTDLASIPDHRQTIERLRSMMEEAYQNSREEDHELGHAYWAAYKSAEKLV